jgi:hypothetical protein
MKRTLRLLALIALALAPLCAEPVALTNQEASRLFAACRTAPAGLTAPSAVKLATNINVLRPFVEAYGQKRDELVGKVQALAANPASAPEVARLVAEIKALDADRFTAELRLVTLTDAEIEGKISSDALAEFLRFLAPPAAPKISTALDTPAGATAIPLPFITPTPWPSAVKR